MKLRYMRRNLETPVEQIFIFESELEAICHEVIKNPYRETGGDLFGLQKANGNLVILFATGSGPNAQGSVGLFEQDNDFYQKTALFLFDTYFIQHLGTWHSHHTLGFNTPSGGDRSSAIQALRDTGWGRFAVWITKHTVRGQSVTDIELKANTFYDSGRQGINQIIRLPGSSPVREEVGARFNTFRTRRSLLPILHLAESTPNLGTPPIANRDLISEADRCVITLSSALKATSVAQSFDESGVVYIDSKALTSLVQSHLCGQRMGTISGLFTRNESPVVMVTSDQCSSLTVIAEPFGIWCSVDEETVLDLLSMETYLADSATVNDQLCIFVEPKGEDSINLDILRSTRSGEWFHCWTVIGNEEDLKTNLMIHQKHPLTLQQIRRGYSAMHPTPEIDDLLQKVSPYVAEAIQAGIDCNCKLDIHGRVITAMRLTELPQQYSVYVAFANGFDVCGTDVWGMDEQSKQIILSSDIGIPLDHDTTLIGIYRNWVQGLSSKATTERENHVELETKSGQAPSDGD